MGFFRSEDMSLYEITVPKDNCWDIMNELGNLNSMHIIDLNKDEQVFNLQYTPFIKRWEETEKKIEFIELECKRHKVPTKPPTSVDDFLSKLNTMRSMKKKSNNLFFEEIEKDIDAKEKFVQEQTRKEKDIFDWLVMFYEYLKVLRLAKSMLLGDNRQLSFGQPTPGINSNITPREDAKDDAQERLMGENIIKVSSIIGTIEMAEKERFKKLVFRATRGNAFTHFKDFDKPVVDYFGNSVLKTVYVVMFSEGEAIRDKLTRLWDSFLGEKYEIPTGGIDDKIVEIKGKIAETKQIITVTKEEIRKYLYSINAFEESQVSSIQIYKWFIRKEKCLYTSLNKLKPGNTLLFGLFWLPDSKKDELNNKIMKIKEDRNISGPQIWKRDNHNVPPPSYFKLNEFTWAFQEITNTYGVPNYKEVNPSVFGIVTFPFLFGVMFGDIGHGFLLFLLGVFAVFAADKLRDGPLDALAQARYLVLLMGFFATFNGVCYNDFMSIPIEGGTCYNVDDEAQTITPKDNCIYAIGIDPTWYIADNELNFINGFKMKMSVIFGVTQMTLGIFMKAFNAIYFGRMVDLFFEFLPQLFLLMCLFGFMDLLIVVKWLTNWEGQEGFSPSIITVMINMFLDQGKVDETIALPIIGSSSTQQTICIVLLLISLVWVPTMLLVKPIYLNWKGHKHHHIKRGSIGQRSSELDNEEEKDNKNIQHGINLSMGSKVKINDDVNIDHIIELQGGGNENHSFGEMFIHQLIETIEFALGTVSNTASYLRLWALSLAHSQLAHVFYDKLLGSLALSKGGSFIMVFLLFPAFFSLIKYI